MSSSLFDEMTLSDQELRPLILGSDLVGGVYSMDYDECVILSNDRWKELVGGIPRHCFLLATATNWEDPDEFEENDAYAILLRVKGPTGLPHEQELLQVREEAMREMLTDSDGSTSPIAGAPERIMDVMTRNEIQFSGIEAKVLGTLYQDGNDIKFGSDIDTFFSTAKYKVYKPGVDALATIGSYPLDPAEEDGVRLGRVRFSETERNPTPDQASVNVDIEDFIAAKTAVFGMTRTGKSNTMKIITTAILEYALKRRLDIDNGEADVTDKLGADEWRIGQLLFDPSGEYANPNPQDERSISELPNEIVTVFRWGADEASEARPLQLNFFDEDHIQPIWSTIRQLLTRDADYVDNFKRANVIGPNDPSENRSEFIRAERRRSVLYATLIKAGLRPHSGFNHGVQLNDSALDRINALSSNSHKKSGSRYINLDENNIVEFWETVAKNRDKIDSAYQEGSSSGNDLVDNDLEALLDMLVAARGSGYKLLGRFKTYHNPKSTGYYAERIYSDLTDGKIVVVDLSSGTESAIQITSERIVRHIFDQAVNRFTSQDYDSLHNIQIYLEEAHNMFNRENLRDADETDDPYVRLAKEAAKYDIGMIYATQEVTGVDQRVLANTANWVVTHLNNENETKELSKYYDFEDFDRQIRNADEPGFARVKTLTGNYIVPSQIDLFDQERLASTISQFEYVQEECDGEVF